MTKTCADHVGHRVLGSLPCKLKAGHGPGGRFCWRHAMRQGNTEGMVALWEVRSVSADAPVKILVRKLDPNGKFFYDSGGRRCSMIDKWGKRFKSEEEAAADIVSRAFDEVVRLKRDLAQAERRYLKLWRKSQ